MRTNPQGNVGANLHADYRHHVGTFALNAQLDIPLRGVTALTGPSGSGKTLLLRCIAGLERSAKGECIVQGAIWQNADQDVFLPPHRRPLGYVSQHSSLFLHFSVRKNLEYGWRRCPKDQRKMLPDEAADIMGIGHLLDRNPKALSGGEKQRVAMARALLAYSKLLLMDEPLASLDQEAKAEIYPYLERLHSDLATPIIYVTHDPREIARIADHVTLMEGGKIVASGDLSDMMTRFDLSLARGEQAMAVIETEVAAQDDAYSLSILRFPGGDLQVPRLPQAIGSRVRVTVLARDVSLALSHRTDTSILNILPARVLDEVDEGEGHVLVGLGICSTRLLARVTRKSAQLLNLQIGMEVFVQVKSVAILH